MESLYYSSTINLLFSLIKMKTSYLRSGTLIVQHGRSSSALSRLWRQIHVRSPRRSVLGSGATNGIWARVKQPRTAHNLRCNSFISLRHKGQKQLMVRHILVITLVPQHKDRKRNYKDHPVFKLAFKPASNPSRIFEPVRAPHLS